MLKCVNFIKKEFNELKLKDVKILIFYEIEVMKVICDFVLFFIKDMLL